MVECGRSGYELIDITNYFDLDRSQIVKIQILSVDRAAGTASISLLSDCPLLDERDLSSVPFFYHCDFSTGSLDDLSFGHMAFEEGEEGYALFSPEIGEIPERFHILGHVDIKGTKKCVHGPVAVGDTIDNEAHTVWETNITACLPLTALFEHKPYNLTQVRYLAEVNGDIEVIHLFHYGYTIFIPGESPTNYRAVSVLRNGNMFTRSWETGDSLQVYGSLSLDFNHLYIASSTGHVAGERAITFVSLAWDQEEKIWGDEMSGPVDYSAVGDSQDVIIVDRLGRIFAAFSNERFDYDYEEIDDSGCYSGETGVASVHSKVGHADQYTHHLFNLTDFTWESEDSSWSYGLSIANGDYKPLSGPVSIDHYIQKDFPFSHTMGYYINIVEYSEDTKNYSNRRNGSVSVDDLYLGYIHSGRTLESNCDFLLANTGSPAEGWHGHFERHLLSFRDHNGTITCAESGGWVLFNADYSEVVINADNYETWDVDTFAYLNIPCPPNGTLVNVYLPGYTTEDRVYSQAAWPVSLTYHSVSNSFYSFDTVSGDWYAGILINLEEDGDFAWKLFKNGSDITAQVSACVGNLIDVNFSAIYFR